MLLRLATCPTHSMIPLRTSPLARSHRSHSLVAQQTTPAPQLVGVFRACKGAQHGSSCTLPTVRPDRQDGARAAPASTPTPRSAGLSQRRLGPTVACLRTLIALQLHHQRSDRGRQKCAVSRSLPAHLLPTMDATSTTSRAGLAKTVSGAVAVFLTP